MGALMFFVFALIFAHDLVTPLFFLLAFVSFLLGVIGEVDSVIRKTRRHVRTVTQKKSKSGNNSHHHSSHHSQTHHTHKHTLKTEDGEEIVSLPVSKTEEFHFVKLADMTYEGKNYAIMQRARHLKNRGIDDAILFRIEEGANGELDYVIERNEKIVGTVFTEYRKEIATETKTKE